jgi:phospholipid-binding lipoprotein MlaA
VKSRKVIALGFAAVVAGCATPGPNGAADNDPFEPLNRAVFRFDEKFDKYVVLPVADIYIYHLPARVRESFHNVMANADLPVTFVNDVLQGKLDRAGVSLGRFAANTTVGLGGLFDVAANWGLPAHQSDFGQTLALWGVGEGPFLVLPVIGPEPPRDLLGDAVDVAMHPLAWEPEGLSMGERIGIVLGVGAADRFEHNARNIYLRQQLGTDSLDPYATMRSSFRQARAREIEGTPVSPAE